MENYKLFDSISKDILKDCDIKDQKEVDKLIECISIWFEMQLFKIISALFIMCQKEDCKKVNKNIFEEVKKGIENTM